MAIKTGNLRGGKGFAQPDEWFTVYLDPGLYRYELIRKTFRHNQVKLERQLSNIMVIRIIYCHNYSR